MTTPAHLSKLAKQFAPVFAQKIDNEWIAADQSIPFVLDGWVSGGDGLLYEGTLTKGNKVVEPCQCRDPEHTIQR